MKKSFSLIELLIMISLILLLSGSGIAYYLNNDQQIKLKSEAKKLTDVLSIAKKKAESSELIPTPGATPTYCANFNGYRVGIISTRFTLKYYCNNTDTIINTYNFPSSVIYTGSNYNFHFLPLGLGTNITVNTVTLKNTNINQCIDIIITSSGIIKINDYLYSC